MCLTSQPKKYAKEELKDLYIGEKLFNPVEN